MPYIVDGSNVLGTARAVIAAKRDLVRDLGRSARAKRTRVVCVFDGDEPEPFGKHLGGVSVVFSGARSADDLIVARVAAGNGWKVVPSDRTRRAGGRKASGSHRSAAAAGGDRDVAAGGGTRRRGRLDRLFFRPQKPKRFLMSAGRHSF